MDLTKFQIDAFVWIRISYSITSMDFAKQGYSIKPCLYLHKHGLIDIEDCGLYKTFIITDKGRAFSAEMHRLRSKYPTGDKVSTDRLNVRLAKQFDMLFIEGNWVALNKHELSKVKVQRRN
jgi:hypothetical protein